VSGSQKASDFSLAFCVPQVFDPLGDESPKRHAANPQKQPLTHSVCIGGNVLG
jgi:hypothetical protein